MSKTLKILLADDHALVREGLKQLFAFTDDISVVAEATNGDGVLELLRQNRPDIILLDITMPGISGAELIARIRQMDNSPPILVLTMHNEPQIAHRALRAGADGYLTKDTQPEILLGAIRKIAEGGRFIDPTMVEALAFMSAQRAPHESLSKREFEIFLALVSGKSLNDIAADLSISNKTVSTHKSRLMEKMGFSSNADMVRYACQHRLGE